MRDKPVHDYFGVDLDFVWDIVATKIPPREGRIVDLG
jgi:uncharacterized protein with HEPN domain